jgi:hypothetical protein
MSLAIERSLMMRPAYLTALAARTRSALGRSTSLALASSTQNRHDRAKQRQTLYSQFISEASKLYGDALAHNETGVAGLVSVSALIGRTQPLFHLTVVEEAKIVLRMIVDPHFVPNETFSELRKEVEDHPINPLVALSEKCREELGRLQLPLTLDSGSPQWKS